MILEFLRKKMIANELVWYFTIYLSCLQFGATIRSEKPLPEKLWREPCKEHSRILNDCNWCWCNDKKRYTCHARVCREVDVFGHFNDAIKEIDIGMEGHGAWRSNTPACEAGVHYQRGELLCICEEEGNWPNPTCRDTFRVLYPVNVVNDVKSFKHKHCIPLKLYLIGCNVCFCPQSGEPNPKYCTRKTCYKDDPIFKRPEEKTDASEIYASCDVGKTYILGCRNCDCLGNNRLLCDNCTERPCYCSNREAGEVFNMDCNICHCDKDGTIHCSIKKCLKGLIVTPKTIDTSKYKLVEKPLNYFNCVGGTKFKVDCRTCYCYTYLEFSMPFCDMEHCSKDGKLHEDCVEGTSYEVDCLVCQCGVYNGTKMEVCQENPKCKLIRALPELSHLRGYCEPFHLYNNDCNTCQCLRDGKTVKCSDRICDQDKNRPKEDSISVDIVPVVKEIGNCPKGRSFKINCNVCFCLSNGDIICTAAKCTNEDVK